MNIAKLDSSDRLKRVAQVLSDGKEHSTLEIVQAAGVCAVNSIISELRRNGLNIPPAKRRDGNFYYQWVTSRG